MIELDLQVFQFSVGERVIGEEAQSHGVIVKKFVQEVDQVILCLEGTEGTEPKLPGETWLMRHHKLRYFVD